MSKYMENFLNWHINYGNRMNYGMFCLCYHSSFFDILLLTKKDKYLCIQILFYKLIMYTSYDGWTNLL